MTCATLECLIQPHRVTSRHLRLRLHGHASGLTTLDARVLAITVARPRPESAVFCVAYTLALRDGRGRPVADVEVLLVVLCTTSASCTREQLAEFAGAPLLRPLHRYLVEHLHRLTRAGRLPPHPAGIL